MVARIPRRLDEFVDDVLRRGLVRVAHAQVDDVLSLRPRLRLEVVDDGEDVGRKTLDPVEVVHFGGLLGGVDDMRSRLDCQQFEGIERVCENSTPKESSR